jgi:hypothetical protein
MYGYAFKTTPLIEEAKMADDNILASTLILGIIHRRRRRRQARRCWVRPASISLSSSILTNSLITW